MTHRETHQAHVSAAGPKIELERRPDRLPPHRADNDPAGRDTDTSPKLALVVDLQPGHRSGAQAMAVVSSVVGGSAMRSEAVEGRRTPAVAARRRRPTWNGRRPRSLDAYSISVTGNWSMPCCLA